MNTKAYQFDPEEMRKRATRDLCEKDHLFFNKYFFRHREAIKFISNWHHYLVADEIEKVFTGETQNLVINVAPGSSKTEEAVITVIARGLAKNPRARFLHISSADQLVMLNSQKARDLILSDEYQELWPIKIAQDAKSKKQWNVLVNGKKAGGVYAVSLGGQITGFRAGHMAPGFQGAILIDDPLKADEGFSKTAINAANRYLLSTVKSRKANPQTPIILIMQRLNPNDCSGFIEGGNMPGKWKVVTIPALIDDAYITTLPERIKRLIVPTIRDETGRFSYWEYKEPLVELLQMEAGKGADAEGNRVSTYVFASQYMQKPKRLGGNIIHGEQLIRYEQLPIIKYRIVFGDTAQKTKEHNDYSVFQSWGLGIDSKAYLLDQRRGKWEAPELERTFVDFWNKHNDREAYPPHLFGILRKAKIEDKVSGTGLIQTVKRIHKVPIEGIERGTDKLTRVMDALPHIEAGFVCIPANAPWVSGFIEECEAFTADDTHDHDDQIDPLCDAVYDLLSAKAVGFFSR